MPSALAAEYSHRYSWWISDLGSTLADGVSSQSLCRMGGRSMSFKGRQMCYEVLYDKKSLWVLKKTKYKLCFHWNSTNLVQTCSPY